MKMNMPLSIFESELHVIVSDCERYPEIETGGALFGLWTQTGAPVVMLATRSGANAVHEVTHFLQDEREHKQAREFLWESFGLQWIGLWHSHHRLGLEELSSGDVSRTRHLANAHSLDRFCEILCFWSRREMARNDRLQVNLKPFIYLAAKRGTTAASEFRLLSGYSPARGSVGRYSVNLLSMRPSSPRSNYTTVTSKPLVMGNLASEDGQERPQPLLSRLTGGWNHNPHVAAYAANRQLNALPPPGDAGTRDRHYDDEEGNADAESSAGPTPFERFQQYLVSRVIPGLEHRFGPDIDVELTELEHDRAQIVITLNRCEIRLEADCRSMKPTRCELSCSQTTVNTYARSIEDCIREAVSGLSR